jgi:hypothetical protein
MVGCSRNELLTDSRSMNTQDAAPQAKMLYKSTSPTDLFRVITDAQSGQYAAVSGDGHVIALKDKSGNPIWTNDIIAKYGTNLPRYSSGKIGSLEFIEGQIVIYVGKECICIEPQGGKILRTASR